MNRKLAVAAAAAALATTVLTGCDHKETDKSHNDNASFVPTAPATGSGDKHEPDEPTEVKAAPPVIHPNILVRIKCMDDGTVSFSSVNINGTSGKSSLSLTVEDAKPLTDTGRDCYFRLATNPGTASFVMATPLKASYKMKWLFTDALTAQGLNELYDNKVASRLLEGQDCYIYAEVNGLPKPDSFNSAQKQTGSLDVLKKDYNRRVGEMNELMLNQIAGITYPKYAG